MKLAPIALFLYRRPKHTIKVLKALSDNHLANESKLHIFCDGPKPGADAAEIKNILSVRKIVRQRRWCKSVAITESETNLGLANSIVQGVTKVVDEFEKVIVLEDDIVTSKGFLQYMNNALELYAQDERVFQVSAFMVPSQIVLEPTGFFRAPASWGWGTWRDAWQQYEHDIDVLFEYANSIDKEFFNLEGSYDYFDQLLRNRSGQLNTWGVRFYTSMLMNHGLCLYPHNTLVQNIGFGKLASNTSSSASNLSARKPLPELRIQKIPIEESQNYFESFKAHYRYQNYQWSKPSFSQKIKGRLKRYFVR